MQAFGKLAWVQTKLYLREPMAVFFTLLFGPLLLLLFGIIFGNQPQDVLGGLGHLDVSVPSYTAAIIGIAALTIVPITAVTRREKGVLRRFAATPLKPLVYFLTDILVPFLLTLSGVLLLFLLGILIYGVNFTGSWLDMLGALCLSTLAFFSLGYALSTLLPSVQVATVAGNVLIIPMNILSGALVPLEVMPDGIRDIARFLPLTYVVDLLRGMWIGAGWGAHRTEILVLAGLMLLGVTAVAFTFKWE